jgi:hypothetical protein
MGLLKAWKEAKALAASGAPSATAGNPPPGQRHAPPHGASGMMAGFMGVMMKVMAPLLMCEAPNRGDPLPGSEPGLLDGEDPAARDAGIAAIKARDSAFDPQTLTTFANQVYAAVGAAWSRGDAATVRPVLADALWDPMGAAITSGMASGIGMLFGLMQGHASLTGVWSGPSYDSARFSMAVHIEVPPGDLPPGFTPDWTEDWLFQRSVRPGSAPMQPAASCPSCGAPTETDETGLCLHCREPIPVLTSGWLVTAVRSHNPMVDMFFAKLVGEMRQNPAALSQIPDELIRLLPVDVVTELAPDRAAALHLHG